ncbi:MAG: type II secretion system protein GspG [Beggiatoa sp. IS2]|nr:MAG: type II secretion system protein GspG [Beggiatoa sp. IS2]
MTLNFNVEIIFIVTNIRLTRLQGFTLIELLIVMAIIGMLAALVGPKLFDKFGQSQRKAAASQISMIEQGLDGHRMDTGKYPKTLEGLVNNTGNSPAWNGPYMKKGVPKDPWGHDYQYKMPGNDGRDYDLFSFGLDGAQGGEGDNADIISW